MTGRPTRQATLTTIGGCAVLAALTATAIRLPRAWEPLARPAPLGDFLVEARRSPFRPWNVADRDWEDRLRRMAPVPEPLSVEAAAPSEPNPAKTSARSPAGREAVAAAFDWDAPAFGEVPLGVVATAAETPLLDLPPAPPTESADRDTLAAGPTFRAAPPEERPAQVAPPASTFEPAPATFGPAPETVRPMFTPPPAPIYPTEAAPSGPLEPEPAVLPAEATLPPAAGPIPLPSAPRPAVAVPPAPLGPAPEPEESELGEASLWSRPQALLQRLERLARVPECAPWARATAAALEKLCRPRHEADALAAGDLAALRTHWQAAERLLGKGLPTEVEIEVRQARYALQRRLDVREVAFGLARTGKSAFRPTGNFRLTGGAPQVAANFDLPTTIGRLETFEATRGAEAAEYLARAGEAFASSEDPAWGALGRQLLSHYRNHNVRVSVHKDFLTRMLPQPPAEPGQVCEEIQGVPVRGHSMTQTQVAVEFHPAQDRLALALLIGGAVDSWTMAESSGVEFSNFGRAHFQARVPLTILPQGPIFGEPQIQVQARQQLRGFTTPVDDLPLMNSLVRSYAKSRYDSSQEESLAEMRMRIASRVRRRIQASLNDPQSVGRDALRAKVLGTLEALSLKPTEADLQTTADRLIVRTRVAAPDHLAAWTPRPEAPGDSVLSVQLHESLANNFTAKLGLSGRRIRMKDLPGELASRFQVTTKIDAEEIPDDLYWTFAERDAIRVEFHEGKLEVQLRFAEVEHKDQAAGDLEVAVTYRPEQSPEGLRFVRDGGVRVHADGETFRTKWYFRALFTKVFPKGKELLVLPAERLADPRLKGWTITQFVLREGWLGVALGPDRGPAPQIIPASFRTAAR